MADTLIIQPPFDAHVLDYRYPAEWEPQRALWLSWPHDPNQWPNDLFQAQQVYTHLAAAVSQHQTVILLIPEMTGSAEHSSATAIQARLQAAGANLQQIELLPIATDDAWLRDSGPVYLIPKTETDGNSKAAAPLLLDWRFNAWGEKFSPWEADDACCAKLAAYRPDYHYMRLPFILEGGAIDTNGLGLLLTTEECLLHPKRNPQYTQSQIEAVLRHYLCQDKIIWLGQGLRADHTDGHIDNLARFVGPTAVVLAMPTDNTDENWSHCQENERRLRANFTARNLPLDLLHLPLPNFIWQGERLAASYTNFIITNQVVYVPTFGLETDDVALKILRDCWPKRQVCGLDARELIPGGGTFHCMTNHEPVYP